MMKMKATSQAAASAKAKAAYQARAKASEVIDPEYPLVMNTGGIMEKVSDVIELPPAAT